MYTITLVDNGQLLFHPAMPELSLANPVLMRSVNEIATLTFTIYPGHPQYDAIRMYNGYLKVYKDGELLLIMRAIQCKRMMGGGREYTCEELVGATNTIMLRPEAYGANLSMQAKMVGVIANYNGVVTNLHTELLMGNSHRQSAYDSDLDQVDGKYALKADYSRGLWDELTSIVDGYQGDAVIRIKYVDVAPSTGDNTWMQFDGVFDYQMIEDTSTTILEYGKNIEDLFAESGLDEEFFTRLIPLGKDVTSSSAYRRDGGDSKWPVTILNASHNPNQGSDDYLDIGDLVERYGIIEKTKLWKDKGTANALYDAAADYVEKMQEPKLVDSVTVTYWDLKAAGYNIAEIGYLEYVRVLSEPHGIDQSYLVTEEKVSLAQPDKKTITLGKPKRSLTDIMRKDRNKQKDKTDNLDSRLYSVETL